MTGSISTAMATSFKVELFEAGHCFNGTVTLTGILINTNSSVTVSSVAGISVGMSVTGTGVPGSTYVAAINSSTTFTMSQAATSSGSPTLTITGDTFNMALIIPSMANSYGASNVNYSDIGSDEVASGGGYTTGGTPLGNVTATYGSTTAYITFSPNPSWTSATFSSAGCMIYNASVRVGGTSGTNTTGANRCCSVHSFGGTQEVTAGTFTVLMPAATYLLALLRIQ